jgi:hypothetical protein
MGIVPQNAGKQAFFVISGRNSGEIEGESHYHLKKQSQFQKSPSELKFNISKRLRKKARFRAPEKQIRFKPNCLRTQMAALIARSTEYDHAKQSQFPA